MNEIKTVIYTASKTCIEVTFLEGGFTRQKGDFYKLSWMETKAIQEAVEAGGAIAKGSISTKQI